MDTKRNFRSNDKNKKFLTKNKSVKVYKQKQSKIELLRKEIEDLQKRYEQIDSQAVKTFDDFPLSEKTRKGLRTENYVTPTEIQKDSIALALKGHDILGAAKTGSGKTLAFVIPMLESLFCAGWSIHDGIGAIVITPTRELAYQIFEVLNKVGVNHHFSVALVIGGKDIAMEKKILDKCNILICTPGRLKHHLDQNPLLNSTNLNILILDEADRILDMGFQKDMNEILEHLPVDRQTLLFSATQTKSVRDLARLSLKNPVYVSVHEHAKHSTPEGLRQQYIEVQAHAKMNLIWSFIKTHKKQKILIFMATCKQVKFAYHSICRLRPGVSIMALYGGLHQLKRMAVYDEFCQKNHAVLFATDIASRGLDFPNVSWVVQLDCPEDTNTYIHRVGRTARYQKNGESLLVLLPSEKESMVEQLKLRKIPIEHLRVNPTQLFDVRRKLESICARDAELKDTADRAFKAYLKSIYLMKDKTVFDVTKISFDIYAKSLGLTHTPRMRFLEKHLKSKSQVLSSRNALIKGGAASDSEDEVMRTKEMLEKHLKSKSQVLSSRNALINGVAASDSEDELVRTKEMLEKHLKSKSQLLSARSALINGGAASDSKDEVLRAKEVLKQPIGFDSDHLKEPQMGKKKIITKTDVAKRILKSKIKVNTITKFNEDGNPMREICGQIVPVDSVELQQQIVSKGYTAGNAKVLMDKEDQADKLLSKEKTKQKHRDEKLKKKMRNKHEVPAAQLAFGYEKEEESESDIDPNNIMLSDRSEDEVEADIPESSDSASDAHSETEQIQNSKKRRKEPINQNAKRQKRDSFNTERSLDADEELALHFLNARLS